MGLAAITDAIILRLAHVAAFATTKPAAMTPKKNAGLQAGDL
jgi:hypothetical protein